MAFNPSHQAPCAGENLDSLQRCLATKCACWDRKLWDAVISCPQRRQQNKTKKQNNRWETSGPVQSRETKAGGRRCAGFFEGGGYAEVGSPVTSGV